MKIAVWYNLPSGGAKRALHDHLAGLKALGHTVELWRPPLKERNYLDLSAFGPEHEVPTDPYERTSAFYPLRLYYAARNAERLAASMDKHARICAAEINSGGFDVLFANTDNWFHAPHIGRYVTIPRVLYLQEPNRPLYEAQPRLPWLLPQRTPGMSGLKWQKLRGRSLIELRTSRALASEEFENSRHYEQILVNSRFSRESVLRCYGVDSAVCYLGIDARNFVNRRLPRERFVISVGSLTPSKGPALVIEAVGRIPQGERPRLVWVYNFAWSAEFEAEMQTLAQTRGVEFDARKLIPDQELIELLNRAGAFVYAPRLEPFGMAPLEANACGAPVVAVAEGGVRETVEDGVNGRLVDATPEALAEGIRGLLADPASAQRFGETGDAVVRLKWSVQAAAERLERHLAVAAHKD